MSHYFYDGNGNVGQLLNPYNGTMTAWYEYDGFGKAIVSDGIEAEENTVRFSTKYWDSDLNMYHYGFRNYSTELGRWVSRDPIAETGGYNLYLFVINNPIDNIDYLGKEALGVDETWWYPDKELNSASEIADSFDEVYDDIVQFFNRAVENNPSCYLWVGAAISKTVLDVTKGSVDHFRFGEGFAKGGYRGFLEDTLRGVGIVFVIYGPAAQVKRIFTDSATLKKAIKNASKTGLKPGTLSNEATRKWYHNQLDSISSKIDSNLLLRERALQAFKMRNEVKLQARELMADRAAAEALPAPKTLQDVVRKAYQQGLRGDDVWHYVLGGSQRSNAAVDSALGLTR